MYFNIADLTERELKMMSAMTEFLGLLPTSKHTASDLQKETRKLFGGLDYNVITPWVKGYTDRVKPFFTVSFSVLEENLDEALDLVSEILTETDFNNPGTMTENLMQCKEIIYQSILGSGNQFAARRVLSNYAASSYLEEKINGFEYLLFVRELLDNFDEKAGSLIEEWTALSKKVFTSSRLIVGETSTEKHPSLERITKDLPKGEPAPEYKEIEIKGESRNRFITQ